MQKKDDYLSVSSFADKTHLSKERIRQLIGEGKIKAERFSKRGWYKIPGSTLRDYQRSIE
jgi:hypothetical protein